MRNYKVPFNKIYIDGKETVQIKKLLSKHRVLTGTDHYTKFCEKWIERKYNIRDVLITNSCTASIEIASLLLNLKKGDEIIMPSYTFVSSANPFILRGAKPVFVDIKKEDLNIDENQIERAITKNTRALLIVHYAGVSCNMKKIIEIAKKYRLDLIEDSAHAILSKYEDKPLGTFGTFGTMSFHETKNIIAGEGGALLINDKRFVKKAEIIREKGTNRESFINKEVKKYKWREIGSSYLPSQLNTAFLSIQLNKSSFIIKERLNLWNYYHDTLKSMETKGLLRRPSIPEYANHNAHIYYIILSSKYDRDKVIEKLKQKSIQALSHYEPLHKTNPAKKFCKTSYPLNVTSTCAKKIIRLPLWVGLKKSHIEFVVDSINKILT